ncbi:hypothetical protein PRIC2_008542 [Phytophthora ramorum]
MTSSLAETSAPMGVGSILDSPRVSPSQDAAAVPAQVSPSQSAQEPQHKQLQARTSRPRAAAAAANAVMAEQAKQEEQPIDVTLARALSGQESPKSAAIYIQETSKRPSRVAAAAANAGITRQAKEEEGSLNMLIASTTPKLFEQDGEFSVKKRTKEGVNGPAAKRSKLAATSVTTKLVHNPLEEVSGGSQPSTSRGKKRRQAAVFEAAPIITDMPPLPFTSPTPKGKAKNKLQADGEEDRRCEFCKKVTNICVQLHCQGCRRVYHAGCLLTAFKPFVDVNAPILDQMERLQLEVPERRGNIFRCASCKAAFLDFYESGGFLWDCDCPTCTQPEKLIYYRQRKLVKMMNDMELERQRKKELKDQKAKTQTAGKPSVPASSRSNSTSRSRRTRGGRATPDEQILSAQVSRRSTSRGVSSKGQALKQESDAVKMEALGVLNDTESGVKNVVAKEEPMEVDDNGGRRLEAKKLGVTLTKEPQINNMVERLHTIELQQHKDENTVKQEHSNPEIIEAFQAKNEQIDVQKKQKMDLDAGSGSEAATQSKQLGPSDEGTFSAKLVSDEPTTPQMEEHQALKVAHEPVGEPEQLELSGDDLVGAVRVVRDDKTGGWCFPVMCSRTSSLRVSGVMKTGKCKWLPKKLPVVLCDCCNKFFFYSQFVHHTDSSLVKDPKCANEDPVPFLFVEHRDATQHTPLDQFQPAFRDWCRRQSAAITPTKGRRSHTAKETRFSIMSSPEAAADEPSSSPSRLRALALFKRPKHKGDKGPIVARVTDPASFEFVAQVVCLPPSYVMNMANGGLADRVMRSQMPVPDDSFPRKSGWLAFNRNASTARQITCVCCENRYEFDAFVEHAGISLSELKIKSRQLLYIVERQDESALVPYKTFLLDLEFVTKNNLFLDELHPPSVQLNR